MIESDKDLELISEKIQVVKESGFGEIRILIKNGEIYRILATEDELLKKGND